jgi:hypothetical protein
VSEKAWELPFNGLRWQDMPPQGSADAQKMNFALWRRGLLVRDADGKFYQKEVNGRMTTEDEIEEGKDRTDPADLTDRTDQGQGKKVKEPKTKTIENTTKMNMQSELLEELQRLAKEKGVSMKSVALGIGAPANFFCPYSLKHATPAVVGSRLLEGREWVKNLTTFAPVTAAELTKPTPEKEPELQPELQAIVDLPPLEQIVAIGGIIKKLKEEIRRLALAL